MNIILFGFKGAGKTYFGKRLASKLSLSFFDTDDLMIQLHKKMGGICTSQKELYESLGKVNFRLLEMQAIESLIDVKNSIIALGGGAILEKKNCDLLQKIGTLVYLDASYETIRPRISQTALGPLKPLYQQRKPLYESILASRIPVDHLEESDVLKILSSLALQKDHSHGF